ncbi:MAG: sterol desaturase family protein [Acidobacteriota bacterium]
MIDAQRILLNWQHSMVTPKAVRDYIVLAVLLLLTFGLDVAMHRNWRRYFSRFFLTDFTYYVVYYGGFYAILYSPLGRALNSSVDSHLPFLRLGALRTLPLPVQVIAFIVASDFLSYWQHRWMHVSPALWSIHKIHHSQEQMTIFTNYRFHLLEETFRRLFGFIPFVILGVGPAVWVWADLVMLWILLMQHSGMHWTYGWLDRIFVSPRYHEVHHAMDAEMHDHNYGVLFSFWDRLFGTRDEVHVSTDRYGVEPAIPEGFWPQMLVPVQEWVAQFHSRKRSSPPQPSNKPT